MITRQDPNAMLVQVPASFYGEHEARGREPGCNPVRRSSVSVWIAQTDPGLGDLLADAVTHSQRKYGNGGAKSTRNAICEWFWNRTGNSMMECCPEAVDRLTAELRAEAR